MVFVDTVQCLVCVSMHQFASLSPWTRPVSSKKNMTILALDFIISLGCVIRGETYHFEIISNQCGRKIMDISINEKVTRFSLGKGLKIQN